MNQFLRLVDQALQANRRLSMVIEAVGVVSLLLIMLITCIDVIGAKMFSEPVPGALDFVMLAQTVAISFGTAATLSVGGHVSVAVFLMHMPSLPRKIAEGVIELLCLILFIIIVWQMTAYGHELYLDGEVSPTAHIPLYPFAYGIALASFPACIEFGLRILKTVLTRNTSDPLPEGHL